MEELFRKLISSPALVGIAAVLVILLIFSVAKRLLKLFIISLILILAFFLVLTMFNGKAPKTVDEFIKDTGAQVGQKVEAFKDSASSTVSRETDKLKNQAEEELKKAADKIVETAKEAGKKAVEEVKKGISRKSQDTAGDTTKKRSDE